MNTMKKAEKKDLDFVYERICDLEQQAFDKNVFAQIFTDLLSDEQFDLLVFERDKELAGFACVRYGTYLHHCAKTAELIELDMVPEERGHGYGTQFLKEIGHLVREKGCVELTLATNRRRKQAHRFYEKNGFRPTHFTYTKNI